MLELGMRFKSIDLFRNLCPRCHKSDFSFPILAPRMRFSTTSSRFSVLVALRQASSSAEQSGDCRVDGHARTCKPLT